MTLRGRHVRTMVLVIAAQAFLVVSYVVVEQQRTSPDQAPDDPRFAAPSEMNEPLPPLELRRRDGRSVTLTAPARLTLLHFWGTWCPPCRTELPGLLAVPSHHPVDVIAVALDADWAPVDAFFDGSVAEPVVLGDATVVRDTLSVRTLPVTFLVSRGGRLVARFDGERRWEDAAFGERWLHLARLLPTVTGRDWPPAITARRSSLSGTSARRFASAPTSAASSEPALHYLVR